MALSPSGAYEFSLTLADLVVESLARIGLYGPAIDTIHIVEARRSMNLMFNDWASNRGGPLLALIDQQNLALVPGQSSYLLQPTTIQVLDVYLRSYTPATTYTTIGSALTPALDFTGAPVLSQLGEPLVVQPGLGVLSSVSGSQLVTVTWPLHGLSAGSPVFFNIPCEIAGIALPPFCVVNSVIDVNNVQILCATVANSTQSQAGGTPLLATASGSGTVTVYFPGHGLAVGGSFVTQVAVAVGGLTIPAATYTVVTTPNSYTFTFAAGAGNATSTTAVFENSGQLQVTSQLAGNDPIDIIMSPMSRTEYASIPDKFLQGRPTSFWFDRLANPSINVWLVPPPYSQGGVYYGMSVWRMRQPQDSNPVGGQTSELPLKWMEAAAAELTARCAEKWRPTMHAAKVLLAKEAWERASTEDIELVPIYITPSMGGYFR